MTPSIMRETTPILRIGPRPLSVLVLTLIKRFLVVNIPVVSQKVVPADRARRVLLQPGHYAVEVEHMFADGQCQYVGRVPKL